MHLANLRQRVASSLVMNLFTVVVITAFLAACGRANVDPGTAARPSTQAATQPTLEAIEITYSIYLARLEIHTTVAPDGSVRCARIDNKSWGEKDIDPKLERRQVREGNLKPE